MKIANFAAAAAILAKGISAGYLPHPDCDENSPPDCGYLPPNGPPDPTDPENGCSTDWFQCGGKGWNGPTCCARGTCTYHNEWYSNCVVTPPKAAVSGDGKSDGDDGGNQTPPPNWPPEEDGCSGDWAQCGGNSWAGPTCCARGACFWANEWYSYCKLY